MCLGIPGKVVEIYEAHGLRMGKVDFDGIRKEACLAYIPDLQIGDYTIIHVGFALSKIDEAAALETLAYFNELGMLQAELGVGDDA